MFIKNLYYKNLIKETIAFILIINIIKMFMKNYYKILLMGCCGSKQTF